MMRTRAWRRYKEECIVKKRLLVISSQWWRLTDINGRKIDKILWCDFIGTQTQQMYKNYTTKWNDTRFKIKYSPNYPKSYWRDRSKKGNREKDKQDFKKMLDREYGLKHYYTK